MFEPSTVAVVSLQTTLGEGTVAEVAFLVGRLLFGAVLGFMGLSHVTQTDSMAGYADAKGVPAPRLLVLASGAMLLLGGLGIAVGAFPVLAAGALVVFLLVTTPAMHDFWAAPDDERQTELIQFLKNAALLGGALAFVALGGATWPYALNVGVF